jgi:diguanylate cyclase (GGDEF)-like protein
MLEQGIMDWMIPAICGLFSLSFFVIGRRYPDATWSFWATAAYSIAGIGMVLDLHRDQLPIYISAMAIPCHWLAVSSLLQAFLARRGKSLAGWPTLLLLAAAIISHYYFVLVKPDFTARVLISAVVGTAICSNAVISLYRNNQRALDRVILGLVIGVGATFIIRILPFFMLNGGNTSVEQWLSSPYMAIFYISSAIYAVMSGLALLLATGIDLVERHYLESREDHLTRLPNRRALDQWMDSETAVKPIFGAVLMIDLDHFKSINDRFGHDGGDRVLVTVAEALETKLGAFARIARIGGEEFAVLIDVDHCEAAQTLALVARKSVAASRFDGHLSTLQVTASVGLAMRENGESLRDTMRCADMALYEAKAGGRNKAVTHRVRRRKAALKAVA